MKCNTCPKTFKQRYVSKTPAFWFLCHLSSIAFSKVPISQLLFHLMLCIWQKFPNHENSTSTSVQPSILARAKWNHLKPITTNKDSDKLAQDKERPLNWCEREGVLRRTFERWQSRAWERNGESERTSEKEREEHKKSEREEARGHESGSEWSTRTQLCRPAQTGCRQIEPRFEFRTAVAARRKRKGNRKSKKKQTTKTEKGKKDEATS